MSVETNKETARRFIEEVFNQHHSLGAPEFAVQDYINHDPTGNATQGAAFNVEGYRAAFPDLHGTITQILGEGDLVAVQWTVTGTHQNSIPHRTSAFALPATGKTVSMPGFSLIRFSGGKIQEVWNHWDAHHLLSQLKGA